MSFNLDNTDGQQLLSAFISRLPEAIIICDAQGSILLHDSQADSYLNFGKGPKMQPAPMIGNNITRYIDKGLVEHALGEIKEQLKHQTHNFYSSFTLHETDRVLHAQVVPVLGRARQYNGVVIIIDDITRQSDAEKHIDALLRLLSKNARSPLASIRAAIEAMRSFPDMERDRQEQFKEIIYNESMVLSELLESASEQYAGFGHSRINIRQALIRELLETVRQKAAERFDITCHIPARSKEERIRVMADPYFMISALCLMLEQLKEQTGHFDFVLSCRQKSTIAFIDICWPGHQISSKALKFWETLPLFPDNPRQSLTFGDVLNQHLSTIWAYGNHEEHEDMSYLRWFIPVLDEEAKEELERAPVAPESRIQIRDLELFDQSGPSSELDNRLLTELSYTSLIREINHAARIEEIIGKHSQLPRLIHSMLTGGTKVRTVTWLVTAFSDAILHKLIGFALEALGEAPVPFSFMTLGSEGRKEQTLKTDQDNAIIFQDPGKGRSVETIQQYFLALGEKVCAWLDQSGFDYCQGNIMALNPKWCQPLSVWKQYFSNWVKDASNENLMHSSIFFDFRHTYGHAGPVEELSRHFEDILTDKTLFFRVMAENANRFKPPIGFFSRFITEKAGPHKNCLDIKKANQPIVDFAKIYSLKHGIRETSTQDRLYGLYQKRVLTREAYNEIDQAYSFNMQIRFMGQINAILGRHVKPDNYIDPKALSSMERKLFKEVLKRIKQIQIQMKMDFIRD